MKTLVVIPTYNEIENLETVVTKILGLNEPGLELLVVDDNSPDGTGALADHLAAADVRVHVLHRAEKNGLGGAYLAGFAWGRARDYDVLCEMDADGSHNPADLPRLLQAVADGADLAIGSRRVKGGHVVGWGPHRHVMSWGAATLSRLALGLKTHDITAGFRAYRATVIDQLLAAGVKSNGYAFQEETVFLCERAGRRIVEVPVIFVDRRLGKSKLSPKEARAFFATIVKLRRQRPPRMSKDGL